MSIRVGDTIELRVTKTTLGKDGNVWITVSHPNSPDHPTFRIMEVPLVTNVKCPLDGTQVHPRCLSLVDGICKRELGICDQGKKHIS